MALNQETIAASGGDHTSLSAAEASIPSSSTDDWEFTYIEALSDTSNVTFSVSGWSGTLKVFVDDAYKCKGAVSGSHAELYYSTADTVNQVQFSMSNVEINDLRIRRENAGSGGEAVEVASGSGATLNRCTIVDDTNGGARVVRCLVPINMYNCFLVCTDSSGTGEIIFNSNSSSKIYRCTVFLANNTRHSGIRSHGSSVVDCRQTLVIKAAGATITTNCFYTSSGGSFNASSDANGATDTTCPGTNTNNSLTPADVIATLTAGSEDLHYPARSDMLALNEGSDLSGTVGTLDIDLDTITEWYPGADHVPGSGVVEAANIAQVVLANGGLTAAAEVISTSATGGIGYGAGAGDTVTQATSKATGVTIDTVAGQITTHNASLAAGAEVSFSATCAAITSTDVVIINHTSGGTTGAYSIQANGIADGSFDVTISNLTTGALGEALVLTYVIIRGATA